MEYLDDLDQSALDAFRELHHDEDLLFNHLSPSVTVTALHSQKNHSPLLRVQPSYLLKLDGPLRTPQDVAKLADLFLLPQISTAIGDHEESASFCRLNQSSIARVENWLGQNHPSYRTTKVLLQIAHKDTVPPTLGVDPTLPQHRPSQISLLEGSLGEYPVWYFFYGSLCDAATLVRLLNLPEGSDPGLIPATIQDGAIRTWGRKYRALVDQLEGSVQGCAYQVLSSEHEDTLRMYEGINYEVVQANILLIGREKRPGLVKGLTFRFAGYDGELQ